VSRKNERAPARIVCGSPFSATDVRVEVDAGRFVAFQRERAEPVFVDQKSHHPVGEHASSCDWRVAEPSATTVASCARFANGARSSKGASKSSLNGVACSVIRVAIEAFVLYPIAVFFVYVLSGLKPFTVVKTLVRPFRTFPLNNQKRCIRRLFTTSGSPCCFRQDCVTAPALHR